MSDFNNRDTIRIEQGHFLNIIIIVGGLYFVTDLFFLDAWGKVLVKLIIPGWVFVPDNMTIWSSLIKNNKL